jgi:hypothetical protein
MPKIRIISGRQAGQVVEMSKSEAENVLATGFGEAVPDAPAKGKSRRRAGSAPKKAAAPKHVGGGWYVMPDGSKVRGRKAAGLA